MKENMVLAGEYEGTNVEAVISEGNEIRYYVSTKYGLTIGDELETIEEVEEVIERYKSSFYKSVEPVYFVDFDNLEIERGFCSKGSKDDKYAIFYSVDLAVGDCSIDWKSIDDLYIDNPTNTEILKDILNRLTEIYNYEQKIDDLMKEKGYGDFLKELRETSDRRLEEMKYYLESRMNDLIKLKDTSIYDGKLSIKRDGSVGIGS